jgi:transcriptional regulator with XRE-family HTH domain
VPAVSPRGLSISSDIPVAILEKVATWADIRDHYERTLKAAKAEAVHRGRTLTQTQIADAGDIRQNAISKLLTNRNLGPSVEVFVGAVLGLGIPLSEFFASLERHEPQARRRAAPTYRQLSDSDLHALELGRYILRLVGDLKPPTRRGPR